MKTISKILIIIIFITACKNNEINSEKNKEPQNIPVQSVEFLSAIFEDGTPPLNFEGINNPAMNVQPDTSFTLTAKVKPDSASNQKIIWNSSNPNAAVISGSGNTAGITVKNPETNPTTTITIMSEGETASGGIASGTLVITIEQPQVVLVQSIDFGPPIIADNPMSLITGESFILTAIITPANAVNKSIIWDSNEPEVAALSGSGDTRQVTAMSAGTALITILSAGMTENGLPASRTLTINVSDPTGEIEVDSITLNPDTLIFTNGNPGQTLTAVVLPNDAADKTLQWGSGNNAVAKVESTGSFTAIVTPTAPGTTTITVRSAVKNTVYATCSVTVNEIGVSAIHLDKKELTLSLGSTGETLTTNIFPDNAANKNLQWTSGNNDIATVVSTGANTAFVTPKAGGTVSITVRGTEANNNVFDTCTVTVIPSAAPSGWIGSNDRLTVDTNGYLRNKLGQEVVLRGTNLGGWMLQESWMCPVWGNDLEWAVLNTIEAMESQGFSPQQIQTLFDTYQDNWITEEDFNWLESQGVNFVRISFWYRNFMSDDQGTWINNDDGSSPVTTNPGFKRLDWAFAQAAKRGIYVCLMMHGAVGGQSTGHGTGTLGKNELYTNSAYEQHTVDLWKAITVRYKDEAVIAVYDLLGEPNNNSEQYRPTTNNIWDAGSERAIYETVRIYDRFYREVRAINPEIICDMEAIWWTWALPDPKLVYNGTPVTNPNILNSTGGAQIPGTSASRQWAGKTTPWTNVMYSMHLYDNNQPDLISQTSALINARTDWKVAVMIGEFNNCPNDNQSLQTWAYNQYNNNKISWASWAYKVAGHNQGFWSLHQAADRQRLNPATASYNQILSSWGPTLRTFQPGTLTYTQGYQQQGMYSFFSAGLNHVVNGVWTKSTVNGFPAGGALGPITAAAAAK